jgi:hypothetical protein
MGEKTIASVLEKKSSLWWALHFFETPARCHITPCKAPYNYNKKRSGHVFTNVGWLRGLAN